MKNNIEEKRKTLERIKKRMSLVIEKMYECEKNNNYIEFTAHKMEAESILRVLEKFIFENKSI